MTTTMIDQASHTVSVNKYNRPYVDLLKRVLCNSIYGSESDVTDDDIAVCTAALDSIRASKPWVLERYRSLDGQSLAQTLAYTKRSRALHTYVRRPGLDNIEACALDVFASSVPGDFIDAGTLRGGTAILMKGILRAASQEQRKVLVADSFEGLPAPCESDSVFDREIWYAMAAALPQYNLLCLETLDRVKENFVRYDF
jgi:O-methyltransferase